MRVQLTDEARAELRQLPLAQRKAIGHAIEKLEVAGDALDFPHSSSVRIAERPLRELRPQQGRCRWRAFYRRVGSVMVVASIGPEAQVDPRSFERAVVAAVARLAALEDHDATA